MDLSSFITSLATSFIIFFVLIIIFTWLSRKQGNAVVYYPNVILRGLDPFENRRRSMNPVGWIKEALSASEADVIAAAGVDAAVYLIFLSTVLGILAFSGILLLPSLLPVSATDDNLKLLIRQNKTTGNFTDIEVLAMGNVKSGSTRLWAFTAGVYWVSIVTYYLLWKSYKHVSNLRANAKSSAEPKPEDFTILVRDVPGPPAGEPMKDRVDAYFRTLHPDSFYKSMVVVDQKEANKLYKKIESYKKKLARAEFVHQESKSGTDPNGKRPTMRTGFMGLIGPKVDSIDHCSAKIKELLPKLEAAQKSALRDKQQPAALIFFNSRLAAASASQSVHAQMIDTWTVSEAPEPRAVIWANLHMKIYTRQIRQNIVYIIVFLTVVFYTIPITFVSAFTTLANLEKSLPFLKKVVEQPEIRTILGAYLPQIALIVFLALLPAFLMFLSKSEGIADMTHAMRAAAGKYFYFIVFNVFLGVTLAGTLFSNLKKIVDHPASIITLFASSLPGNATFFLTFVALKFFVGYGLELSRLVPLIIFHLKRKYMCKTEDEIKAAWAPGDFGYATRVPNDMLIITIVLCYSVIAPLIIPFGVVYFGLGWLVAKTGALRVYVPSCESNGRMWPHIHTRILAALIIYQITMLGFMALKKFVFTPILFPLIPISLIFAFVSKQRFYRSFSKIPLEVAAKENKVGMNMEAVYMAYIPPCLKPEKIEDVEVFEDAQSHSRTASF
ncbi:hypothetical protein LUZ60_010315 [Juncus effusus]|nr:hypothetical protein LUZ60_010315 [Juncus effusus]